MAEFRSFSDRQDEGYLQNHSNEGNRIPEAAFTVVNIIPRDGNILS